MCAQHRAEEHVHVPCQLRAAGLPCTGEERLLSPGLATTVPLLIPSGGEWLSLTTSFCLYENLCGDQSVG